MANENTSGPVFDAEAIKDRLKKVRHIQGNWKDLYRIGPDKLHIPIGPGGRGFNLEKMKELRNAKIK
ncbi:MAG TPA: hypothetical protein VG982_01590 [Candidatus Paceibacterota bacterium]|nr:hypothetical protein [Candidatus Paceibacterota bacterium]